MGLCTFTVGLVALPGSEFLTWMTELYDVFPALIKSLIVGVVALFVVLAIIRMVTR
jgi:hypothetical protein